MHTDKTTAIWGFYLCLSVSICGYRLLLCVCRDAAAGGLPLGFDLAGVQALCHEVVGLLCVHIIGLLRILQVRLLAEEEVLVRHGVIVLGIDLHGSVEVLESVLDDWTALRGQLRANLLVL